MTNKITDKDIKKCYWNTYLLGAGWNYERMQGLGYLHAMLPVLDKMYVEKEDRVKAAETYMEFFNTNPHVAPVIVGANISLVESNPKDFDAVRSLKLSLMGPLAAVGDTILIAVFGSIIFAIGASLALSGSNFSWIAGILPLLLFVLPIMILRYKFHYMGYKIGKDLFVKYSSEFEVAKKYAFIVGLTVIGALASSMVKINLAETIMIGSVPIKLRESLNSIMPNLVVFITTILSYKALGMKKMNSTRLLGLVLVLGTILGMLGILV